MRAPTIFGRMWISGGSVISNRIFAQLDPLPGVVAAYDRGAARLDAFDLCQRFGKLFGVPGIAGQYPEIQRFAQADRIGREKERAAVLERDERAHRPRRVPGQGNENDASVAENIAFGSN